MIEIRAGQLVRDQRTGHVGVVVAPEGFGRNLAGEVAPGGVYHRGDKGDLWVGVRFPAYGWTCPATALEPAPIS